MHCTCMYILLDKHESGIMKKKGKLKRPTKEYVR